MNQGTLIFCFQAKANYSTVSLPLKMYLLKKNIFMYLLIYIYLFIHHEYNDMARMNGPLWQRCRYEETGAERGSQGNSVTLPRRNVGRITQVCHECESAMFRQHYLGHRQQRSLKKKKKKKKIFVFIFLEHFCKILTRWQHGKKDAWGEKRQKMCQISASIVFVLT